MRRAAYISGFGHLGIILLALFGGLFSRAPKEPEVTVTQVELISEVDFFARDVVAPSVAEEVAPLTPGRAEPDPVVEETVPEARPVLEAPAPAPRPEPEPVPEVEIARPEPPAELVQDVPAPEPAPVVEEANSLILDRVIRPRARPAPRVAPEAVPTPEPDRVIADVASPGQTADPEAATPAEETAATAPEEAATETATEAEGAPEETVALAPLETGRPRARPERAVAAEPLPEAPTEPEVAEAEPAAEIGDDAAEAIANAVSDALAESGITDDVALPEPEAASLSAADRNMLRLSVESCWNVGSLSTDALLTTVVVGFEMTPDGKPRNETIALVSSSGGGSDAVAQAFEAARRAVIVCGASGFDLPVEKYELWDEIEMTFNPERMRSR